MKSFIDTPPKDWTLELFEQISLPAKFEIEYIPSCTEFFVSIEEGKLRVKWVHVESHYRFTLDEGNTWICCHFNDLPPEVKRAWIEVEGGQ